MFFSKLAVSLSLAAPFVSALSITTPTNWTSGGPAVITWAPVAGDPQSFSIELLNTVFHNSFAIGNNIQTGALSLSLELPIVPVGDGYTLEFVNVGNITDVFASTPDFSIGAVVSSSSSSSASSTPSAASTGSAGSGSSVSATSLTIPASSQTSSGFGVTVSAGSSSGIGSSSGSVSSTSSSSSVTPSAFNNGAVELGISRAGLMGYAVMAGAALAGARLLGF